MTPDKDPGPRIPFLVIDDADRDHPLSAEDRERLAAMSTIVRYKKGDTIFRDGAPADDVFCVISGVVKSAKPDNKHVIAFLWPGDLLGSSENGKYSSTATALTPTTMFKSTVAALEAELSRNANLNVRIISKLCMELRESQRHAFTLSRRRAVDRLAMFLEMLGSRETQDAGPAREVYLPMSRIDIAAYLGISPEAVTRGFQTLQQRGAIRMRDARHIELIGESPSIST